MSNQVIKINFGSKEINVQAPSDFEEFKSLCQSEFSLDDLSNFIVQYKDDDGDDVNVDNESDYGQALNYMNDSKTSIDFTIKEKLNKSRTYTEINNDEVDPMRSAAIFQKIPNLQKKKDESDDEDDDEEKKKEKMESEMKKYKMELEEQLKKEYNKKLEDTKREMEEKSKKIEDLWKEKEIEDLNRKEDEQKKIEEEKKKIEEEKLKLAEQLKEIERKKIEEEERKKKEKEEEEERRKKEEEEKRKKEEEDKRKKEEEKRKKEEEKEKKKKEKEEKEKKKKEKEEAAKKKKEEAAKKKKEEEELKKNNIENINEDLSNSEKEKLERKKRLDEKIKEKVQNDLINSKNEHQIQNEDKNDIIDNIPLSDNFNKMLSSTKDEYSNELKREMTNYIENEVKKLKDDIVKKTLEKNEILISNYIEKLNKLEEERKSKYQTEISKYSKFSMSNCNTVHIGVKCENCGKNPIQGIRYKCTICNNYNLCENCEELNSIEKFHSQDHDFIRMRNERKNNQIPKQNLNNNDNLNNENYNIFQNNEENIINYNYECLTKNPTVEIDVGTKQINYEFIIKCSNSLPWIKGTKLVCNKMHSNIICHDIELPELQIGQQTKVCCQFNNLDNLNVGKHKTFYEFYVNDKLYGNPLVINIEIKNNDLNNAMNKLRNEYGLKKEDYSDEKLKGLLTKHNNDLSKVINELFN